MGASRFRLISHLILESALVSLAGGWVGIPLAVGAIQLIKRISPADLNRVSDLSLVPKHFCSVPGAITLTALLLGALTRPLFRQRQR